MKYVRALLVFAVLVAGPGLLAACASGSAGGCGCKGKCGGCAPDRNCCEGCRQGTGCTCVR